MRKKIVAGNWKMNKNLQEGIALATELNTALAADKPNCDVVICTPFIHLATVAELVKGSPIAVAAENCADHASGAYTGEVSAEMVASTGATYCIIGHSERRTYYGETYEILREKVQLALANNLRPIFCIGEVKEEREANRQNEVVKAQLEGSVFNLSAEEYLVTYAAQAIKVALDYKAIRLAYQQAKLNKKYHVEFDAAYSTNKLVVGEDGKTSLEAGAKDGYVANAQTIGLAIETVGDNMLNDIDLISVLVW